MEDYARNNTIGAAKSCALHDIQDILSQMGLTCSDLGLPVPQMARTSIVAFDIAEETQHAEENLPRLNPEQRKLVDAVFGALDMVASGATAVSHAFFLDGPGGSGKTMVYNTLISAVRSKGMDVSACAWTGIAATLLRDGRTVHSLFKLPVPITDKSTCDIRPGSSHAKFLLGQALIIIDEASMVPLHALRAIDVCLRDITGCDVPFGGRIILLVGDYVKFFQLCPMDHVLRLSRTA